MRMRKARSGQGAKATKKKSPPRMLGVGGTGMRKRTRARGMGLRSALGGRMAANMSIEGVKYAMAALHPCSERSTEVVALPDDTQLPRHCTRMQRTMTVGFPTEKCTIEGSTVSLDQCSWNLLVVASPWPEYSHFIYMCDGAKEPPNLHDYLTVQKKVFYDGDVETAKGHALQAEYYYYFAYPNAMQGTPPYTGLDKDCKAVVVGNDETGHVLRGGVNGYADPNDLRNKYTKYRVISKGMTTYLNASRLVDGGRVICGQYPMASRFVDTFDPATYKVDLKGLLEYLTTNVKAEVASAMQPHYHQVAGEQLEHQHFVPSTTANVTRLNTSDVRGFTKHGHVVSEGETVETKYDPPGDGAWKELYCTDTDYKITRRAFMNQTRGDQVGTTRENPPHQAIVLSYGVAPENCAVSGGVSSFRELGANARVCLPKPWGQAAKKEDRDASFVVTGEPIAIEGADIMDAPGDLKHVGDADKEAVRLVEDRANGNSPTADWFVSSPPSTENMLFYGDSKATTWEARKGTYQPVRVKNLDWQDCQSAYFTFYKLGDKDDREIKPNSFAHTPSSVVEGTGTWTIAYYRNISKATSVTVKVVQYAEGVVNPQGPYANLQTTNADPDRAAVDFVTAEVRRLAHAYPADYNDLGKILGEVFKVAKNIGGVVKGVSNELSGVPVIGDIAKTITGILGGLGL